MLTNYLKTAWRSLWKHKAYSLINIVGLSIGLTACLIVATVVFDELSYDNQWTKGDDIYRVLSLSNTIKGEEPQPVAFAGFGPSVKKDLPEVVNYCRMSVRKERLLLTDKPEGIAIQSISADPNIWGLLDFKIIAGNPQKFVKGCMNLIITEKIRDEYFHGQDPVGKIIYNQPEYGKPQKYLITGVIASIPQNSHLRADVITVAEYRGIDNELPKTGYMNFCAQYLLLQHGISITGFTNKVNNWYAKQMAGLEINFKFRFQPMKDVYLRSDFSGVQENHGSIRNVYIFAGVAVLLLLIACVNFINLTVSRVFNRAKETGIRKVLGAEKFQLIIRFMSESVIFFIIAFAAALLLYPVFLKPVETYLGHRLVLDLHNSGFLAIAIGGVFLVSLVTGLYPAWFLSRPQPIVILRNKVTADSRLSFLKKSLVVGQFAISVAIILVTFIVHNQLYFMSQKDLGFDKNNLLNISFTSWGDKGEAFKQLIKQTPGVQNASISSWYPTGGAGDMSREIDVPGQKTRMNAWFIQGDADLPATMGFKIRSGRLLSPAFPTDAMNGDSAMNPKSKETIDQVDKWPCLATNYTASLLSLKLNQHINGVGGVPVGIIEDFNSESLHNKLHPTFIQAENHPKYGNMLIRVKPGYEKQALVDINKAYKEFYPEKTFGYDWVNNLIDAQYKAEHKLQQLFTCFSMLIVFLACLGLFGLVSFTAEQRIKEIGIRKVLGAGVSNIITLICKDYLVLIMIAFLIASPVAWFFMQKWLQDFAYRIHIQWWVFAATGILTLLIALITVSFQSVKAALANPVKSLRAE